MADEQPKFLQNKVTMPKSAEADARMLAIRILLSGSSHELIDAEITEKARLLAVALNPIDRRVLRELSKLLA